MNLLKCVQQEPFEEYEARKATHLNAHAMMEYHRDPSVYKALRDGVISRPDTYAYSIGRALHVLVCEGREAYDARYVQATPETGCPVNAKTGACYGLGTKATAEWEAEQAAAGKSIISAADAGLVEAMYYKLETNPHTKSIFYGGAGEVSVVGHIGDVPCQCRCDYVTKEGVVYDLKTCQSVEAFDADAARYLYWYQAAFYTLLLKQKLYEIGELAAKDLARVSIAVIFVAVEKSAPYRVALRLYSDPTMAAAQEIVLQDVTDCHQMLTDKCDFLSPFAKLAYFPDITPEEMKRY